MAKEHEENISKKVQELYLYPYRSKGENVLRGGAWMASWIVGIVVQQSANQKIMGGAYFIFALSLLLEFVPEGRTYFLPRIIHGFFCVLLFIMLLGSLFLSFAAEEQSLDGLYAILENAPAHVGWIVFVMMLIGVGLVFFEAHKLFSQEESTQNPEREHEIKRTIFMESLNGNPKGGNT